MSIVSRSILRHELIQHPRLQYGAADGEHVDHIGDDEHGPVDHVAKKLNTLLESRFCDTVTLKVIKRSLRW